MMRRVRAIVIYIGGARLALPVFYYVKGEENGKPFCSFFYMRGGDYLVKDEMEAIL